MAEPIEMPLEFRTRVGRENGYQSTRHMVISSHGHVVTRSTRHTVNSSRKRLVTQSTRHERAHNNPPVVIFLSARRSGSTQK